MKVLLLEDDLMLSQIIQEHLEDERGYEVIHFTDGEEAWEFLYENRVDFLLLDVNVPSLSGFELLKTLRSHNITTPAIIITSLNESQDVKSGFDIGCDDYIKKPFEFDEFDARIEHILKVYNIKKDIINLGCCKFDYKRNLLIKEDQEIQLTQKTSQILHYLYKNRNNIVKKRELIQNIWEYENTPNDSTIRTYIKTLRRYIPNIKTHRGIGYEFISL